jgi:ribonuclease P protein component
MGSWCACAPVAAAPSSVRVVPRAANASAFEPQQVIEGGDFRPEHRLRRPAEFAAVRASSLRLRGERFEVRYRRNGGPTARLGLVIPKNLARRAVLRNLIKRLIREGFRVIRPTLPGFDLVFRLLKPPTGGGPIDRKQCGVWRAEIDGLLAGLPR